MSRISDRFSRARAERRKLLVVYLTACDPDLETSRRAIQTAIDAGADIIEVGVPWSDPSADGPVIQAAMLRALRTGGGMGRALELCRSLRTANPAGPLILFNLGAKRVSYATIGVMQYIAPSMLFAESVLLFGEPLSPWTLATFLLIWTALAMYTGDAVLRARETRRG